MTLYRGTNGMFAFREDRLYGARQCSTRNRKQTHLALVVAALIALAAAQVSITRNPAPWLPGAGNTVLVPLAGIR
jgi:hypothetical protein